MTTTAANTSTIWLTNCSVCGMESPPLSSQALIEQWRSGRICFDWRAMEQDGEDWRQFLPEEER